MTETGLGASWQVFRFTLRDTAAEYAKAHVQRIATLPLEPTDPERIAPVVDAVFAELERDAVVEEASPVLRAVRRVFRPSGEERDRRRLRKAWEAYARAWRSAHGGS